MSIKRMACVFEQSTHKGAPYYTLLALANFANDDGYCWPSMATIAFHARISRSTAFEAVDKLLESGELIKLTSGHTGKNNEYIVTVGLTEHEVKQSVKHYTRPDSGRVQYSDPSGNRTTPVRESDYPRPAAGLPPSGNRTPTISNHQETVNEPGAPAQCASAQEPVRKKPKKAADTDPEYAAFHTRFFRLWDEQYRETTRDERYRFNGGHEGTLLKRSKLAAESFEVIEASVMAFLRITERQDKYLSHHRDIKTFLGSWNHRLLAQARIDARSQRIRDAPDALAILLAEDEAKRQRQLAEVEKSGKSEEKNHG